jgi:hypothetical protein
MTVDEARDGNVALEVNYARGTQKVTTSVLLVVSHVHDLAVSDGYDRNDLVRRVHGVDTAIAEDYVPP